MMPYEVGKTFIYYFLYYILYILFDISYNAYRKEVI
jgi:hypothetical protein